MAACDTIVWLDPPRRVCLAGVIARRVRTRGRPRDDVGPGCPERLTLEFLRWIWSYRRKSAPRVAALCADAAARGVTVVHLRSRRAAEAWLTARRS